MTSKFGLALAAYLCGSLLLFSADKSEIAGSDPVVLSRSDSLPVENFEDATDPYLEGYIQALVDAHYYEYKVVVSVKDHHVYLSNLPKNELLAKSIISYIKDLPGVKSVEVREGLTTKEQAARAKYVEQPRVSGVWFPQSTVLFQPLVADPREPRYAAALRLGDKVIGPVTGAVAMGDDFPFFRWRNVFRWHGDMQIGVQGAVWAVFSYSHIPRNKTHESCELVNADYFFAIPVTYAVDKWSYRFRLYHISSHLGDEFLMNHKRYCKHKHHRHNPSFEAIDFFTSYQMSQNLRFYVGPGVVFHCDRSFKLTRPSAPRPSCKPWTKASSTWTPRSSAISASNHGSTACPTRTTSPCGC